MLEFNFGSFDYQCDDGEAATKLIEKARELAQSSNQQAVSFLVNSIGVYVTPPRDEGYFAEALNYLCGRLFASANKPQEAASAIAASHLMPNSGGDLLFQDAAVQGIALEQAQDAAISRGVPAVALASMPRAASATLTQTLAKIVQAPIFRVSLGAFPNYWLVPVWLDRFLRGGGILHDHFGASEFNVGLLRDRGVRSVFVLVRDPREAASSYTKMTYGARSTESDLESTYSKRYIPWLRGWLDAEKHRQIEVRWIRTTDVISGPDSLRKVLASMTAEAESSLAAQNDDVTLVRVNFSGGDSDAWRRAASPHLQQKMWDLLPIEIIERLELRR